MDIESYKLMPMDDYKKLCNENYGMKTEIKILKENLKTLEDEIYTIYNLMMGMKITKEQDLLNDIEEI